MLLSKERRSWWENRFELLLFSPLRTFCNRLLMIIVYRPLFTFENFLQSMSMFSTSMLHQGVVFHSSMDVLHAQLGCWLKFFLDVGITKIFLSGIEVLHAQLGWLEVLLGSPPDKEDVVPEHLQHLVLVPALGDQGEVRHVHFKEHRLRLDLLHLERQNYLLERSCWWILKNTSASSFAISIFAAERCS